MNKRDKKEVKLFEDIFKELDGLMETVFVKHDGSLTHKECHDIVDIWPMTRRFLQKLHKSICRRLRSRPIHILIFYFYQYVRIKIFSFMKIFLLNDFFVNVFR